MWKHQSISSTEAKEKIHGKNLYNSGEKSLREIQVWSKSAETPMLSCPIPGKISGLNSFAPEIHLSNRIIMDLSWRHRNELVPVNLQRSKKLAKRFEIESCVDEEREEVNEPGIGEVTDEEKPRKGKSVTFLDEKLREGFTNVAFVLSPSSGNESQTKEDSPAGGIVNAGYAASPVETCGRSCTSGRRPKPIISASEEFLESLNRVYSPEKPEGISNEGFILSPSDAGRNFVESESAAESKILPEKKKKKGFVDQIRIISHRKSVSEKENFPKGKTWKSRHGGLLKRKNSEKVGKSLPVPESETFTSAGSPKYTQSVAIDKTDSPKSGHFQMENRENPFDRHLQWKFASMSKLPIRGLVDDAAECSGEKENRHFHDDLNQEEEEGGRMDFWVEGFRMNNRKKVDKINKINIHLHALFSAVENGHVDKARTILESSDVDVNSINGDGFTPLDVAILTNHRSLAKMLLAFGAQQSNHFQSPDKLDNHLKSLLIEAEKRVQDLSGSGGSMTSADSGLSSGLNNNRGSFSVVGQYPSSSSISGHGGTGDSDKELFIRERRVKGLRKMLLGFDQTRPPDLPFLVTVEVTGTTSVTVRFQAPEQQDSSICTKYKVQWAESENFDLIAGEKEITDPKCQECFIGDLEKGKRYWFRVACGNLKGFGNFKVSTPTNVVPSSWRDGQGKEPRFSGTLHQLEELFEEVRNLRPETASEIKDFSDQEKQGDSTAAGRRAPKKKTIKQLFTVAGKFQKHLKRGVYLVCLFYHDDKILVTNEDFLPAIEVDETYPSSINNDLHWFMKVACTWSDVKSLKQDMEKNLTSTTSHFRIKLLQAAQQMQSNLSTQDLGQLYYKPIRDAQGTLAFCAVNCFVNLKSVSVLNLRWTPISKIQKKMVASEESNVGELLMASIQSQIAYHRVSNLKLSKGLYLGYLKMKSSVDLIQIIVPTKTPNVLPHYKIRNNPHVSSEEWEWLKRINSRHKSLENLQSQTKDVREADFLKGTEQQQMFVEQVASTARKLFSHLDVSLDDAMLHRLYDVEVVDLNSDVTFLIIVPPVETSCSVPGQKDILLERGDLMSISLQVFEMVHLGTYQPDVISRYSRLSCILELDLILAQHSHREAFSSSEVVAAKDRLTRLQELQIQLNGVWKSVRWIMDLITFARDRNSSSGSLQLSHPKPSGNLSGKMSAIQTTSLSTGISSCGVNSVSGVPMKHLLALTKKKESSKKSPNRVSKSKCTKENHHFVKCEKRCLLQIPDSPKDPKISKSNVSRGSWPGLGLDNSGSLLDSSFSKSEQHLNVLGGGNGGDGTDDGFRKFSDCSSDYVTGGEARTIDSCDPFVKPGRKMSSRDPMSSFENRMLFSRSEDYLFMGHDVGSLKQSIGYHGFNRSRMNPATMTTTSVSATNSPLLPQRNLCESTLNRNNGGSSLSVANTNTSGSLHSVSSDESTAAVVSLPVTTPYRSNAFPTASVPPVQHSASLMSLAKPIIPPNGGGHVKPKIPVTLSLNSLTEISNGKRVGGGIVGGSILSGNIIPVDINQKPQKTSGNLLDAAMLNPHISSSLPSFSKHTSSGLSNLLTNVPLPVSGHGNQRIRSPVKSPIKAVSPTDTVLSRVSGVLRSSASVQPSQYLPFEADHRKHVDLTVDGSFPTAGHKKLSSGDINPESTITSGFSSSVTTGSRDSKLEDETEDLENGVKVPALSSGVLQVYAAYETGLASGTSLKLHVTPRTSAREVVDLVVKQLNMAVLLKGKDGPIYTADKLKNFCLVAVIGARERCLRDDFKPLQLQNPWKKGRLYVRQKQDVLAAIEYSSRQTAFL